MVSESADQLSKRSHRSKIFFNFGKLTFQKKKELKWETNTEKDPQPHS